MKESLQLTTAQRQQLKLAPMQMRFARMLEMSTPEVEESVRNAIDEMPALEVMEDTQENEPLERVDDLPAYRLRARNTSPDDTPYDFAAGASERPETLLDALADQLLMSNLDDTDRAIAANIIGNLDDNGYITRDLQAIADDLATQYGINVDRRHVYRVWQAVRDLDPAGIAAVDLRDCLLLQLKRLPRDTAVVTATEVVTHYFDIFSKMHYKRLAQLLEIDDDRLREAVEVIRSLNPKPGASFASGRPADDVPCHVTPDFLVEADGDRLQLTMLSNIPELTIERSFAADTPITPGTTARQRQDAARLFIRSKREEAQEFIRILSMRQETLYRVMQAILKFQRDFFMTGDESLIHPMILRDISEATGYGISIISRATSGKYVATDHGTYPLKMLFNERPKEDNDQSTHQVMSALKELIEGETKKKPLSDEQLTTLLTERGFDIARRTVAKYRERLGYPVARLRKTL